MEAAKKEMVVGDWYLDAVLDMQVWIGVVPKGPNGTVLNSTYQNRNSVSYKDDLGNCQSPHASQDMCWSGSCTYWQHTCRSRCTTLRDSLRLLMVTQLRAVLAFFARQCSIVITGNLVASLANIVPDGLLVFFPSYSVLEMCIEHWKSGGGPFANCCLIVTSF